MSLTKLPPSATCSCDKCGRNLNWTSDADYMVFDLAEWPDILGEYGWELRSEEVWCEDCLWQEEERQGTGPQETT